MKEIAIEVMPEETRMVVVENGQLQEVAYERKGDESIVNRIYKGVIRNILPGMKAAFVDIGLGRNAYLRLNEPSQEQYGKRLFVGQSVLVQVVKEEMLGKAARVTTDVSLAGRFMVLLPFTQGIKISKRITDSELRNQLRMMTKPYEEKNCGFIMRTAAAKATPSELLHDISYLYDTYQHIQKRFSLAKAGSELYRDADFWLRIVRDYVTKDVHLIQVTDKKGQERLQELLKGSAEPPVVSLYEAERPLFEALGVENEINAMANAEVPLPSGGDLRIDRTEALTVIDVNSKSYTGKNESADDTALAVNIEAAKEACRQLRLRDIGGIIIIDFIDMHSENHKQQLLDVLHQESKKDRVRTVVCGLTSLGLVEMTRKREKQGLQEVLTDTCSCCGGSGYLLSAKTIYLQIVRKLYQLQKAHRLRGDVLLQVHPEVAAFFTKRVCERMQKELCRQIAIETMESSNREAYAMLSL